MVRYSLSIFVPEFIDRITAAPLLLLRWMWYGYTFRRIKLANSNKQVTVDHRDYAELSRYVWWSDYSYGSHRVIRFVSKARGHTAVQMHRQIMRKINPDFGTRNPKQKPVVDHINRNSLDNRRANLRLATHLENARNRVKINKKCSSKYKGVCRHKQKKKWAAQINLERKSIHLGYFDDETEAAKCYDEAAKKYHGEFACLNFEQPDLRGIRGIIKGLRIKISLRQASGGK